MSARDFDMTDHLLSQHFDSIEADDARADRFEDAKEALTTENAIAIREALVKPGSRVSALLNDADSTNAWFDGIEALIRRAADPLPLLPEQVAKIGADFVQMVNAAIAAAAVPGDKQVQARVDEDARCAA